MDPNCNPVPDASWEDVCKRTRENFSFLSFLLVKEDWHKRVGGDGGGCSCMVGRLCFDVVFEIESFSQAK